jgi:hypothetical protein
MDIIFVEGNMDLSEVKNNQWYAIPNDGQYSDFTAIKKTDERFDIEDLWEVDGGEYTNVNPNTLPEMFQAKDDYLKIVVTLQALNDESLRKNWTAGEIRIVGDVKTLLDVSIQSSNLFRVADCGRVKVDGFHVEGRLGEILY